MERKIVGDKEYVFERINVNGQTLTLAGIISAHYPNMVEFSSYRPSELMLNNSDFKVFCSIDEFMSELKYLCEYLNKNGIDDNTFSTSFSLLLEKHINEIGRLIDTDLYCYIDKGLILLNSIMVSHRTQLLPDDAEKIWLKLCQLALNKYKNYVYTTKYDMSNPLSPKPYLVKLTEI